MLALSRTSPSRLAAAAFALGPFAAATWFVWFGWDDVPYQPWQVIGCGLLMCVGAVAARVWAGGGAVLLAGAATVGFAIPWGV